MKRSTILCLTLFLLLLLGACSGPKLQAADPVGADLRGQVTGPAGSDLLNASVTLIQSADRVLVAATTLDDAGFYYFHDLDLVDYTLLANADGNLAALKRGIRIQNTAAPLVVNLWLTEAGVISGNVALRTTLPGELFPLAGTPGVGVSISDTQYETITTADGSYSFPRVPAGIHNLTFSRDGYQPVVQQRVVVTSGEHVRLLPVQLQPDASPGEPEPEPVAPDPVQSGPEEPAPELPEPDEPGAPLPEPEQPEPAEPEPEPEGPEPETPEPEVPEPEESEPAVPVITLPAATLHLNGNNGQSVTGSFSLRNAGDAVLYYSVTADSELDITLSPAIGNLTAGRSATINVSSVCSADASGAITISSNDPVKPEIMISVQRSCTPVQPGGFNIQLEFAGSDIERYRPAFEQAASRWSSLITSDLRDVPLNKTPNQCGRGEPEFYGIVDDLLIHVMFEVMPAGILGSAGPCWLRPIMDGGLPYYGTITLNTIELPKLSEAALVATIMHEMGHILGIGTLWDSASLLDYAGPTNVCRTSQRFTMQPTYTGAHAKAEYAALRSPAAAGNIPVEGDTYGPGTRCGHWQESVFGHELMTGILNSLNGQVPLSRMTLASLRDLGYNVDMSKADPYVIPAPGITALSLTPGHQLEEIILYPQAFPDGVATPVD